jgi:hypothetical protein
LDWRCAVVDVEALDAEVVRSSMATVGPLCIAGVDVAAAVVVGAEAGAVPIEGAGIVVAVVGPVDALGAVGVAGIVDAARVAVEAAVVGIVGAAGVVDALGAVDAGGIVDAAGVVVGVAVVGTVGGPGVVEAGAVVAEGINASSIGVSTSNSTGGLSAIGERRSFQLANPLS